MKRFNLIVTHLPGPRARREVISTLKEALGSVEIVGYWQSTLYALVDDPVRAVEALRGGSLRGTSILRVIPVHEVVEPYIDRVREAVHRILAKLPEGSVAVKVDGYLRNVNGELMHRRDAAVAIMEGVERPVNLKNPDILVYVKVARLERGRVAAVYVGPPTGILSTVKEAQQG